MLFDKAVRRRQLKEPSSYAFSDFSQSLNGRSEMRLSLQSYRPEFLEDEENWPERIEILTQWKQVPIENNIHAQEVLCGRMMEICDLYDPGSTNVSLVAKSSRNRAVIFKTLDQAKFVQGKYERILEGQNLRKYKFRCPFQQQIYEKSYLFPASDKVVQYRDSIDAGWMVTPPFSSKAQPNIVGLFGYGLYAPEGAKLSEIEQVYSSLASNQENKTSIRIYRESLLSKRGLIPPRGGKNDGWFFQYLMNKTPSPILADIKNHMIEIQVKCGEEERTYVSTDYRESDSLAQKIELIFIPKGGE